MSNLFGLMYERASQTEEYQSRKTLGTALKEGFKSMYDATGSDVESKTIARIDDKGSEQERLRLEQINRSEVAYKAHALTKISVALNIPTQDMTYQYSSDDKLRFLKSFARNITRFPGPSAPLAQKVVGAFFALPFLAWHLALAIPNLALAGLKAVVVYPMFAAAEFFATATRWAANNFSKISKSEKGFFGKLLPRLINAVVIAPSSVLYAAFSTVLFLASLISQPIEGVKDLWRLGNTVRAQADAEDHSMSNEMPSSKRSKKGLLAALTLSTRTSKRIQEGVFKALAVFSGLATAVVWGASLIAFPVLLVVAPEYLPAFAAPAVEFVSALFASAAGLTEVFALIGSTVASGLAAVGVTLAISESILGVAAALAASAIAGMGISALVEVVARKLESFGINRFLTQDSAPVGSAKLMPVSGRGNREIDASLETGAANSSALNKQDDAAGIDLEASEVKGSALPKMVDRPAGMTGFQPTRAAANSAVVEEQPQNAAGYTRV